MLACGVQGLEELVRTSHSHQNQTVEAERAMIVASKLQHQKWGPKKEIDRLRREQPDVAWHADSTAGAILKRAGLVRPRVCHHRVAPLIPNRSGAARPPIRSGALTSRGISLWAMVAVVIP